MINRCFTSFWNRAVHLVLPFLSVLGTRCCVHHTVFVCTHVSLAIYRRTDRMQRPDNALKSTQGLG